METRERGGVGSELCGRQERSMPLRAARRSGGWPVSGPVSPLTRAALRVMTAPGLSARCARPPTSCQVETPSNTDRGREGGRGGEGAHAQWGGMDLTACCCCRWRREDHHEIKTIIFTHV